jgi:hypothetical protein
MSGWQNLWPSIARASQCKLLQQKWPPPIRPSHDLDTTAQLFRSGYLGGSGSVDVADQPAPLAEIKPSPVIGIPPLRKLASRKMTRTTGVFTAPKEPIRHFVNLAGKSEASQQYKIGANVVCDQRCLG